MKLNELLKTRFTLSVELVPPRNGSDPDKFFSEIKDLKADFVSVTKGAGGSLRGGTLPISYKLENQFGLLPVAHFVCRERTAAEVENDLIDLHYFNIQNILALRGDAPAMAKDEPWNGDYVYAYQLVEHIRNLNSGKYLPRKGVDKEWRDGVKTDFCIIVAGHPEDNIEEEIEHIKKKVEAGAEVITTQMVFSSEEFNNYLKSIRNAGINLPVIAGIRPLTSVEQAESAEKFFGIKVSEALKKGLKEKGKEFGLDYAADMIKKVKEHGAVGAHLFVVSDIWMVDEMNKRLSQILS